MKEYKNLLKAISQAPFNPIYNIGEKKYSLSGEGSMLEERVGELREVNISQLTPPSFFEITRENWEALTQPLSQTKLKSSDNFNRAKYTGSLFTSYLVSCLLEKYKDNWWIDSLVYELGDDFNTEFLLKTLKEYRELILEAEQDLKIYIPYHWIELALLTTTVEGENMSFVNNLKLNKDLDSNLKTIIEWELKEFRKSIKDKRLSRDHKEYLTRHLIYAHAKGKLKKGQVFPYDTKGKKVEKVSIKIITIPQ